MKVAEDLAKVDDNTTNFDNYTFLNMRERDEFGEEIDHKKRLNDALLEKLSSDKNYTKKRKPVNDSPICYKTDNAAAGDDDNDDDDDDDGKFGCAAKFNETLNMKAREASVYFPIDVFDKGKKKGYQLIDIFTVNHRNVTKCFDSSIQKLIVIWC